MTVPFLEVVMHTTNEALKQPRVDNFDNECQVNVVSVMPTQEQEKEKVEMTNVSLNSVRVAGSLILPICSLIFIFVFWAILSFHSPNVRLRSDLTS